MSSNSSEGGITADAAIETIRTDIREAWDVAGRQKDKIDKLQADNERLKRERDEAISSLEEIAEVGSGYGGRKKEEASCGYSSTTGEGHQECRQIADATLKHLKGQTP